MSFVFHIKSPVPVKLKEITDRLPPQTSFLCDENEELANSVNFYSPATSSRSINLSFLEDRYEVVINVLSSPGDHRIALKLCEVIASLTGSTIKPESHEEGISLEEFREQFNENWIADNCSSGVNILEHIINKDGKIVQVPGYQFNFCIGKKLLGEAGTQSPDDKQLYSRLIEQMVYLQQVAEMKIYIPNVFQVQEKAKEKLWTYTVFTLNEPQFVRYADHVLIPEGDSWLQIPFEKLEAIHSHPKVTMLDEAQFLTAQFSAEEAEHIRTTLRPWDQYKKQEKKKWWQFWN